MNGDPWHKASMCDGKERFASWSLAHEVVARHTPKNRKKGRHVYRCDVCKGYHVGRPTRWKARG